MEAFDFGQRLKDLRKHKKMTQEQVGQRLGVTRATVAGWEQNTKTPGIDTLINLARLYSVSTDYLLNLSERRQIYIDDFTEKQQDAIIEMLNIMRHGFIE